MKLEKKIPPFFYSKLTILIVLIVFLDMNNLKSPLLMISEVSMETAYNTKINSFSMIFMYILLAFSTVKHISIYK